MNLFHFFHPFTMADKKNNAGVDNTGENNSGNRNSGNRNSGYWNSGDGNSGNRNSGYWNSGAGNSGNRNSGDGNSGDGNSGNRNSGCFNTDEPYARFFNRESTVKLSEFRQTSAWPDLSDMSPCVWVEESIMTAEEKKEFPSHKTTGGYIKKLEYKDAWSIFWRKTTEENKKKVLALPNFNSAIFKEITGIDVEGNSEAKQKAQALEDEATKLLAKAKELRESL